MRFENHNRKSIIHLFVYDSWKNVTSLWIKARNTRDRVIWQVQIKYQKSREIYCVQWWL